MVMTYTPSVPKYKSFQKLHYKLHTDVYRHILECRFTHFAPYVVHSEISEKTYIQERREYVIENNDNHETCHHDFNFHSHDSYFVEFAPTTIDEKKFAYVESNKFSMLLCHEKNAYVIVILLNSFMMILKIIMREEHMLVGIAIISCFLYMCSKF